MRSSTLGAYSYAAALARGDHALLEEVGHVLDHPRRQVQGVSERMRMRLCRADARGVASRGGRACFTTMITWHSTPGGYSARLIANGLCVVRLRAFKDGWQIHRVTICATQLGAVGGGCAQTTALRGRVVAGAQLNSEGTTRQQPWRSRHAKPLVAPRVR